MWRAKKDEGRRFYIADRGHSRRRNQQRLHVPRDTGFALFPPAKVRFVGHRPAWARLLDWHVYTTNRRVWEHDEDFKSYLTKTRALGIDMETATIFIVGFVNHIPKGALLLVSDNPMTPEGVKTSFSDVTVTDQYVTKHLEVGIDALIELRDSGESVMHLKFE